MLGRFALCKRCCTNCDCECMLVEIEDLDLGICAWFTDREIILTQTSPGVCEWEKPETAFQTIGSDPYDAVINLAATGTALTLTITITNQNDANDEAVYTMTGTAGDANCMLWYRESLTTSTATGDTICGSPLSTSGTARVSWSDCDCAFCTATNGTITVGLSALTKEGPGTYSDCCNEMAGNWVLPWVSGCNWSDEFLLCEDTLRMVLSVNLTEDTEDTAIMTVTMSIYSYPGGTLQIEAEWTPTVNYPFDCIGGSVDLGTFNTYSEFADMDCNDPPTSPPAGCNVVDPAGKSASCDDCCNPQPGCQSGCP